jgi:hypothetical protein
MKNTLAIAKQVVCDLRPAEIPNTKAKDKEDKRQNKRFQKSQFVAL